MISSVPQDAIHIAVDKCIRDKGMGVWRGSMGVSLERFCEAAVGLAAIRQDMKVHPENY